MDFVEQNATSLIQVALVVRFCKSKKFKNINSDRVLEGFERSTSTPFVRYIGQRHFHPLERVLAVNQRYPQQHPHQIGLPANFASAHQSESAAARCPPQQRDQTEFHQINE